MIVNLCQRVDDNNNRGVNGWDGCVVVFYDENEAHENSSCENKEKDCGFKSFKAKTFAFFYLVASIATLEQ